MMLLLLWIICGIWFFYSAKRVKARPWPWVLTMIAFSLAVCALLAVIGTFSLQEPHYADPGHYTSEEFAAFKRYDSLTRVIMLGSLTVDILAVVGLRFVMMRKVPFHASETTQSPSEVQ